jgi:hypothetical protein
MNVWLYAKCRTYVDPDEPEDEQVTDAEVEVPRPYHDNRDRHVIHESR